MECTYLHSTFTDRIKKDFINTIMECGSRDCLDAVALYNYYKPKVLYSFECNPESTPICVENINGIENIKLIQKAVGRVEGQIKFYATDMLRSIDKNIGASSLLVHRDNQQEYFQKEIEVECIRLDTFMQQNNVETIDLLCMDLQGAELLAIEGLGRRLGDVHYIISEISMKSYYHGDMLYCDFNKVMEGKGFVELCRQGGDALYKNVKHTMTDWITGEKFIGIANMVFAPENTKGDCNSLVSTFCLCDLKEINIIYTHTVYVKELFDKIRKLKSCEFVVITHNCDANVNNAFILPDNVIHWFSQNVNVKNPRIESIPIGLENDRWCPHLRKKEKMEAKLRTPRKLKNLVYMCHNVKTNPAQRFNLYELFEYKSWISADKEVSFDKYLDNVYSHKFMICPEGNGIDTVRTWECLYMGTIPIEKRNINNQFYTDLPISFVDDWRELTVDFLGRELERILSTVWNREKLTFEYWKNKILSYDK